MHALTCTRTRARAHTHTYIHTYTHTYMYTYTGNLTLDQALDRIDDDDFATNPDPINYGLEAGDIVFAFFGSVLLVVLGFLVVLGYFIHPVFLS